MRKNVLVAGAGWAGLAAAVSLTKAGHQVTIWEASRQLGGRARALDVTLPDGKQATLDNGQHILIGAYSETLSLMREVGVDLSASLLRMPLSLRFPNGDALQLPDWKKSWMAGLDVAWGVLQARGWSWADKFSLLKAAAIWRLQGFECKAQTSVAQLCEGLTPAVMQMLIEPLCVSALNTPANRASGQVFLRILRDSLFAPASDGMAGSNLLLPRCDLSALFPQAAMHWLAQRGCDLHLGQRLTGFESLSIQEHSAHILCRAEVDFDQKFDALILATPPVETARLVQLAGHAAWAQITQGLQHEAIATVYAHDANTVQLPLPMMALHSDAQQPAQFVFDRSQLTGQRGLLAFVVSASQGDAQTIEQQVIAQGRQQLNLPQLQAVKTVIDKRATFACTPNVQRPPPFISNHVLACGDYVQGPYPSTLEGAVRSGLAVAQSISNMLKPN
jgi:hydroxysqualene dehydroxylase